MTDDALSVRAYRDELALCVIKEAQRLFPNAIQFHFHAPIQKVDLHRRLIYHGPPSEPDVTQVHISPKRVFMMLNATGARLSQFLFVDSHCQTHTSLQLLLVMSNATGAHLSWLMSMDLNAAGAHLSQLMLLMSNAAAI